MSAESNASKPAPHVEPLPPLSKLAAQYRVAILIVTHLNKSSGSRAMYRATGSLAFAAAARSAWLVTKDPNDARRRLVLPINNHLGNDSTGLAYSIIDGAVAWEPNPIKMTADEALAQEAARSGGESSKQSAAAEWLAELLREGPLPVAEAERQAIEAGFSKATLRRSREALNIRTMKSGFEGGWRLALPEGAQPPPAQRTGGRGREHLRQW